VAGDLQRLQVGVTALAPYVVPDGRQADPVSNAPIHATEEAFMPMGPGSGGRGDGVCSGLRDHFDVIAGMASENVQTGGIQ
jgi:hypothetical protein